MLADALVASEEEEASSAVGENTNLRKLCVKDGKRDNDTSCIVNAAATQVIKARGDKGAKA